MKAGCGSNSESRKRQAPEVVSPEVMAVREALDKVAAQIAALPDSERWQGTLVREGRVLSIISEVRP